MAMVLATHHPYNIRFINSVFLLVRTPVGSLFLLAYFDRGQIIFLVKLYVCGERHTKKELQKRQKTIFAGKNETEQIT